MSNAQVFSMEEAAEKLRVSRRALQNIVKRYPYYYPNGNRKLFTDGDIKKLLSAIGKGAEVQSEDERPYVRDPYSVVLPKGDMSWILKLGSQAQKRAKRSGIQFSLSGSDLVDLAIRSGGKCQMSGIPFDFTVFGNRKRNPFRPSLDRKDSSKGYIRSNVRLVCCIANLAMNEWGEGPLREFVTKMAEAMEVKNV
ncbi:hypothetical protein ABWH97_00100 [Nitratireductor sp. ac15]